MESSAELPMVVNVDDHVIGPAHLFETWLPAKYREREPQPLRAGIGQFEYVGGRYRISMDPDGPPTDWWIYEDLQFPYKRNIAAGRLRPRRDDPGGHHPRPSASWACQRDVDVCISADR
jgi:hypothetical protein